MDEQFTHSLRWVLLTADEAWSTEMAKVLDQVGPQPRPLAEVQEFLEGHLEGADPAYQDRMKAMIAMVQERLEWLAEQGDGSGDEIGVLAAEYAKVDDELEAAHRKVRELTEVVGALERRIAALLPEGGSFEVGGYRFSKAAPRHTVSIDDPDRVPVAFQRPRPDTAALEAHWRRTGDAPEGVSVSTASGGLDVVRVGHTAQASGVDEAPDGPSDR